MAAQIVVPQLGESVIEATVGRWLKKEGDPVMVGEPVVELETEKVDREVGAESAGVLTRIERKEGEDVKIGDVLGVIEERASASVPVAGDKARTLSVEAQPAAASATEAVPTDGKKSAPAQTQPTSAPVKPRAPVSGSASAAGTPTAVPTSPTGKPAGRDVSTPSARRLARERELDLSQIPSRNTGARLTAEDVQKYTSLEQKEGANVAPPSASTAPITAPETIRVTTPVEPSPETDVAGPAEKHGVAPARREERLRMSRGRQTIARRLVEAQHTAAMLTTFNEVDMGAVMDLRRRQKDAFKQRHGVGLGIVSFFVKASIAALREFPRLNAEMQDDEMVLKYYYDIGIAVGASGGLVVPVLRDADRMSFAEIETGIKDFARKAEDGTLSLEDLKGGTFTITNGGVFGSLLSTPILNPPQVGILGLHKVQERPVTVNGQMTSRPMMYIALSYDHRIVDGSEAVQFLVRVKELAEEPGTLLLEG